MAREPALLDEGLKRFGDGLALRARSHRFGVEIGLAVAAVRRLETLSNRSLSVQRPSRRLRTDAVPNSLHQRYSWSVRSRTRRRSRSETFGSRSRSRSVKRSPELRHRRPNEGVADEQHDRPPSGLEFRRRESRGCCAGHGSSAPSWTVETEVRGGASELRVIAIRQRFVRFRPAKARKSAMRSNISVTASVPP